MILAEQERLYREMDPLVRSGTLSRKWLLDELEKHIPGEGIAYPDRLRDWHRDHILLYTDQERIEFQSTAALLLMRRLDRRKYRNWLPARLPTPQSYLCWRRNIRHEASIPYEMPLLAVDPADPAVVVKPPPPGEESPYVLYTNWKGACWDDEAWLLTDEGAIRWVGEPTDEHLASWLSPQEMATLATSGSQTDRAKQALSILAVRFLDHHSSSHDSREEH